MENMTTHLSSFSLPTVTLCRRELIRFYRQRSRIIGVIGSPLIFWFLIGSGLGGSFRFPGAQSQMNYLEYFFPGTIVLIILFTSIFSTISIIEDRKEGFLQSVLVAPISRSSITLGKILGGSVLALLQAVIMLPLAPVIGISLNLFSIAFVLVVLFIISFGLTGLGFLIAWNMESTQGFHAIMNLFLIPLWLLSGALFPVSDAAGWLTTVMMLNPLSYGVTALRQGLYLHSEVTTPDNVSLLTALIVTATFALLTFLISTVVVNKTKVG
ncbi:MAG: ABC transporter permease [Ignavibacteria bacterium]|nr:ABC transporter permease [Ignavibacteria bacterium]MBI3765082.1 ABC transporter permease [Ignavibacteriales bacterium]